MKKIVLKERLWEMADAGRAAALFIVLSSLFDSRDTDRAAAARGRGVPKGASGGQATRDDAGSLNQGWHLHEDELVRRHCLGDDSVIRCGIAGMPACAKITSVTD
jgi:hypothetical protein